ncbi:MAG: carboxypeptidase regulatory-like domain-containing protein [Thermomicrobiales bacterium]
MYQTVFTAPDGGQTIRDLRDGTYLLTVSAPGYATITQQLVVTSGMVLPLEIALQPLPGTLAGTVTNALSGKPVASATVTAGQWHTETDAEGRYTLAGLPPGAHTLQVAVAGYQLYEAAINLAPGALVAVHAMLTPLPAALLVRVTDAASGEPISGAALSYGAVPDQDAGTPATNGNAPCPDLKLLAPLKRSAEFATIRRRVADHHHLDAWVDDSLHFFVFLLRPEAASAPAATNGAGPHVAAADGPVAVFAMRPDTASVHSAVVVTSDATGAAASILDLRNPERSDTVPLSP